MPTNSESRAPRDDPERFDPEISSGLLVDAEHRARYWIAAAVASNLRVLDAGCGTGYGTALLSASGAKSVTAFDIASEAIAATRARVGDAVNLTLADIHELPYENNAFDLVVCFEVIEHVDAREKAIQELRRVLTDDGALIISSPNRLVYPPGNPHHVYEYTPDELAESLQSTFARLDLYQQHTWMASAILPREAADSGQPFAGDLRLLQPLARDAETYTIAVASPAGEPPKLPTQAALADTFEVRWWHDQRAALQQDLETARQRYEDLDNRTRDVQTRLLELEAQNAELVDTARRLAECSTRLASVTSSASWRLTRPLRWAKRVLLRRRRS